MLADHPTDEHKNNGASVVSELTAETERLAGEEDTAKVAVEIHQVLAPANAAFDWRGYWAISVHGLRWYLG